MKTFLVVTSINAPNKVLRDLSAGCEKHKWGFIVAGDSKSPEFDLPGCTFLSLADQRCASAFGRLCPEKTYARKNLGYLATMEAGADVIVETDDDNRPLEGFWRERNPVAYCRRISGHVGWVNAYAGFTDKHIYPRGLPLTAVKSAFPCEHPPDMVNCPIQQGLANGDPDVDAVYRMLFDLPFDFRASDRPLHLGEGAWCPFNSQNTTWFRGVFPLMYLPAYCSFRMCDIWRSFIAQRILPGVMFHGATVFQDRNAHDLHRDFIDEVPGYLHNVAIREALLGLTFPAEASLCDKLRFCYGLMISHGWIGEKELPLVDAWCDAVNG